jgi:predicted RNase H-like HicB family nuclease
MSREAGSMSDGNITKTQSGSFGLMVEYHYEDGTWWAESTDLPGFSAAADTLPALTAAVGNYIAEERGEGTPWYWGCTDGSWPGGTEGLLPQDHRESEEP